ncbi:MAG: phage tail protein [Aliihoeflea sp.]|uniref:phage tail protein n=1 Tax=Aliihoeflea sp. TaxID=2608088 RepID=UPI0040337F40
MANLIIGWGDRTGLDRFAQSLQGLTDKRFKTVVNRVVNRTGDMARTQVRRELTGQTGLPLKTIVKAVAVARSQPGTLTYRMTARGGDISLKFFRPRETRAGVVASPFGKRQVFGGTFIKGGRFPNRKGIVFLGHVMQRVGKARFPIKVVQSGVVIPNEMTTGATVRSFHSTVQRVMPQRLAHELRRLPGGAFG